MLSFQKMGKVSLKNRGIVARQRRVDMSLMTNPKINKGSKGIF